MQLQLMNGPRAGEMIPLSKPSMTFGRTAASDYTLEWDALVSSRHFEIVRQDQSIALRDLGSRNGSLVNGVTVQQSPLKIGDVIQAGQTSLQVCPAPATETAQPAVVESLSTRLSTRPSSLPKPVQNLPIQPKGNHSTPLIARSALAVRRMLMFRTEWPSAPEQVPAQVPQQVP
jgi:pSer/pThr/pTyr-binding forkhead associated (FHA) protein